MARMQTTRRVLQNDHSVQKLLREAHPHCQSQDCGRHQVWINWHSRQVIGVWDRTTNVLIARMPLNRNNIVSTCRRSR